MKYKVHALRNDNSHIYSLYHCLLVSVLSISFAAPSIEEVTKQRWRVHSGSGAEDLPVERIQMQQGRTHQGKKLHTKK